MKLAELTRKNTVFFVRYYRLTAIATLVSVAVIVGSLMIGDSVRATLVKRVAERIGNAQTIIFSRNSFMDTAFVAAPLFDGAAKGILLTNGFISHQGELIPVTVWGVDYLPIPKDAAMMNPALQQRLEASNGVSLSLRLPATGMTPSGSLFVTRNYTTAMRLSYSGLLNATNGGNINLRNEQTLPFNLFINRSELAEAMQTEGKINLILTDKVITTDEVNRAWNYSTSGLKIRRLDDSTAAEIVSDRIFLQDEAVRSIVAHNRTANRVFSYLANRIIAPSQDKNIVYSFVTALDSYNGQPLQRDDIMLSDYSAKRLHAQIGDSIRLTYYVSQDMKTLREDTITLRVNAIVPLSEWVADKTLSADFPGLSDVEKCTDWDSDLPINMSLITDEDEKYWEQYRSAPKAIIAYERVADAWRNAYGSATAIRIADIDPDMSALRTEMFGIQVIYPREIGLKAAANGVDFSGLFLALGFFIIVAALLLLVVPFSEMLYRRGHEIDLLQTIGYSNRRIAQMFWRESAPVIVVAAVAGVALGWLYTSLTMQLLGSVWRGATHTDGFSVYPNVNAILIGAFVGIILSLCLTRWIIARNLRNKKPTHYSPALSLRKIKAQTIVAAILIVGIVVFNSVFSRSIALFVVAGACSICLFALYGSYLIRKKTSNKTKPFDIAQMIWSTLFADRKQAALSFFALSTGIFIVLSVGLNRQDFADGSRIREGTGGYSLWCESSVPVYHNMATREGREKLSLTELPADIEIVQCLRYVADDASCLNLNKVNAPTVLGVDMKALSKSDIQITQHIDALSSVGDYTENKDIWVYLQTRIDTIYPALVDATVLEWNLGKRLGDTLHYRDDRGRDVAIRLVGALPNTIFQGNILVDRALFSEIWPETTGSEISLVKVKTADVERVGKLLSQALSEYGVRVSTTNDRLKEFNSVTDTYLTIFMTLGGIGLLLGIVSFIVVVRKGLVARRREIDLYATLGFGEAKITGLLRSESLLVPLYAIATGVISSLIGISGGWTNISIGTALMAVLFVALVVGCAIVFVTKTTRDVIREQLEN